jgi:hypothetical protein
VDKQPTNEGKQTSWKSGSISNKDDVDKFVNEIMALVKGKGKGGGNGDMVCWNCGKTGHLAKDCWAPPKGGGKMNGKGDFGKTNGNQYGQPSYQKGTTYQKGKFGMKGAGKGGPKGGCWICGGAHYSSECPRMKGGKGGKGLNGLGGTEEQGEPEKESSLGLGGGKGEMNSNEWDYEDPDYWNSVWAYSLQYDNDPDGWTEVRSSRGSKQSEPRMIYNAGNQAWEAIAASKSEESRMIYNVDKQAWEKITFVGDSGAVDHVINKESAKAFKLHETPASKAGIGFRAANNTLIKNYGEKRLTGFTDKNDDFSMNVQVTDVKRNLASFNKMVEQGKDVILSQKGSFIKDPKSGKVINLNMDKGTPTFDVWVPKSFAHPNVYSVLGSDKQDYGKVCKSFDRDNEMSSFQRLEMHI